MRIAYVVSFLIGCSLVLACGRDPYPSEPQMMIPTMPDNPSALVPFSNEYVTGIQVRLRVHPVLASPGDTIQFLIEATNLTDRTIQIGTPCGPALDSYVFKNGAISVSVLQAVAAGAVFTCELGPHHFADPGETETLRLRWPAPPIRGEYIAIAGIRRADGLGNRTEPVKFEIR